jgi:hypothetical protein
MILRSECPGVTMLTVVADESNRTEYLNRAKNFLENEERIGARVSRKSTA